MFNKLLSKFNPTEEKFLTELLKRDFDDKILLDLIKAGISINHTNDSGDTCLNVCISKKRVRAALWLIKHGCDPTILNNQNKASIDVAIYYGSHRVIKALLALPSVMKDINKINDEGRTLLHDAVINGESIIVDELINHSADMNIKDKNNRNILFDAIDYGDERLINKILSSGKLDVNTVDIEGNMVLHKPEVLANDELAKQLLLSGANPTVNNSEGKNFLFHMALRGDEGLELLDIALAKGCSLNGKVRNNNSLLMEVMAAFTNLSDAEKTRRKGLMAMAKKFVKNGIDVNAINDQGETVLFYAVRKNDVEAVAFLLDDNMKINQKNKKFETALSIAVIKGIKAIDIILLLLEYKADVKVVVKDLKTILEVLNDIILHVHGNYLMENQNLLAQIDPNGHYLVVLRDILGKISINLDYNDFAGDPIYFKSLLYGNTELFRLYIKYGIDINKRNKAGNTLFQEYVLRVFETGRDDNNFEQTLLMLVNNKADVNLPLPKDGKTILSFIASKKCNLDLFKILLNNTRFNFRLQDNSGRTVIHSCVTGNNVEILRLIHGQDKDIINIADYYNLLPLTYSALMGNASLLMEMISLESFVTSDKEITTQARAKFSRLLPNLDKLSANVHDKDILRKISIVCDQIRSEFII